MLRRAPLFSALSLGQVGSGVQPDLHALQKVLWAEAQGVTFTDGKVQGEKSSCRCHTPAHNFDT